MDKISDSDFLKMKLNVNQKVSTFQTSQEMVNYCQIKCYDFLMLSDSTGLSEKLRLVEEALGEFKIYNRKCISATLADKKMLDSFYATFQLMTTHYSLELRQISIQDLNFQQIKDQLIVAFDCEKNYEAFKMLRYFTEYFMMQLLRVKLFKIARVFLMLCIKSLERQLIKSKFPNPTKKQDLIKMEIFHNELQFLESFLARSLAMMEEDIICTEEQEAKELIFKDLLEKLGFEDYYKDVPEVIKTFEQAEKLSQLILPKIDKYEKLSLNFPEKNEGKHKYAHHCLPFSRGQLIKNVSHFQKDIIKKAELAEKSMKHFKELFNDTFSEKMVKEFVQKENLRMLILYLALMTQNSENFKVVIVAKVHVIMNSTDLKPKEIKSKIRQLNIVRREFILQMQAFAKVVHLHTALYYHKHLRDMYYDIATQFRSILLDDKKNQKLNLQQSRAPLIMYHTMVEGDLDEDEAVDDYEETIDNDPFIKKYRKN